FTATEEPGGSDTIGSLGAASGASLEGTVELQGVVLSTRALPFAAGPPAPGGSGMAQDAPAQCPAIRDAQKRYVPSYLLGASSPKDAAFGGPEQRSSQPDATTELHGVVAPSAALPFVAPPPATSDVGLQRLGALVPFQAHATEPSLTGGAD